MVTPKKPTKSRNTEHIVNVDVFAASQFTGMQTTQKDNREYTGGSVNYYKVPVILPTSGGPSYVAECNDIIEALGMNYAEGNAFKAIWRSCAARNLGLSKKGYNDQVYDAEKVVFFGNRMLVQREAEAAK